MTSIDGTFEINYQYLVPNSQYSNQWIYNFGNQTVDLNDCEIALWNGLMFYSFTNINTSIYNNNTFQITMPLTIPAPWTWTVQLPTNTIMSVDDINNYIQLELERYGFYLIQSSTVSATSTGTKVFFLSVSTDGPYYKCLVQTTAFPTSLGSGYTLGTGTTGTYSLLNWGPTGTIANMTMTIPTSSFNTNFGGLLGFTGGSISVPSSTTQGTTSTLSSFVPEISPSPSIYILCNLVSGKGNQFSTSLYSFSATGGQYSSGAAITLEPKNPCFKPVAVKNPSSLTLTIVDQNAQPLPILEPMSTFTIAYRKIKR